MYEDQRLACDKHYAIYISFGLIDCSTSINHVAGMKFHYIKSLKRRKTEYREGIVERREKNNLINKFINTMYC